MSLVQENGKRENPNLKMKSTSLVLIVKVLCNLLPSFLSNRPSATFPHQLSRSSSLKIHQAPKRHVLCKAQFSHLVNPMPSPFQILPGLQNRAQNFPRSLPSCSNPPRLPLLTPSSFSFYRHSPYIDYFVILVYFIYLTKVQTTQRKGCLLHFSVQP